MSDEKKSAGQGQRRQAVSALNALDLALQSQEMDAELARFLKHLLPLLDGVENLCRDLDGQPQEEILRRAKGLALLPELADEAADSIGLERFGKIGDVVDRQNYEVVSATVDSNRPHGTVLEVTQRGWMHESQPLRRAKVIASVQQKQEE